jgi:hypothetical protein
MKHLVFFRSSSISTNSLPSGMSPAEVQQEVQNVLSPEDIPKRYREAIIHYSKVSFCCTL